MEPKQIRMTMSLATSQRAFDRGKTYTVGQHVEAAEAEAWVRARAAEFVEAETPGSLPEFFPAVEHLRAAGLVTLEAVQAKTPAELEALPGIGRAAVKKIVAALKAQA